MSKIVITPYWKATKTDIPTCVVEVPQDFVQPVRTLVSEGCQQAWDAVKHGFAEVRVRQEVGLRIEFDEV